MNRVFQYIFLVILIILILLSASYFQSGKSIYDEVFRDSNGTEYVGTYTLGGEWTPSTFRTCDGKYIYNINYEGFPGFENHPQYEPRQTSPQRRFLRVRAEAIGSASADDVMFPEKYDAEIKIYKVFEASEKNIFNCTVIEDESVPIEIEIPVVKEPPPISTLYTEPK